MANRKQQKRRYLRAQGRGRQYEAPGAREVEERPQRERRPASGSRRAGRVPQPPSMRRTARRAGIWAVFWLLILQLTALGNTNPVAANVLVAGFFFVVLWAVGWFTESFAYRRWLRRREGGGS